MTANNHRKTSRRRILQTAKQNLEKTSSSMSTIGVSPNKTLIFEGIEEEQSRETRIYREKSALDELFGFPELEGFEQQSEDEEIKSEEEKKFGIGFIRRRRKEREEEENFSKIKIMFQKAMMNF